jgi:hypothetical protein
MKYPDTVMKTVIDVVKTFVFTLLRNMFRLLLITGNDMWIKDQKVAECANSRPRQKVAECANSRPRGSTELYRCSEWLRWEDWVEMSTEILKSPQISNMLHAKASKRHGSERAWSG